MLVERSLEAAHCLGDRAGVRESSGHDRRGRRCRRGRCALAFEIAPHRGGQLARLLRDACRVFQVGLAEPLQQRQEPLARPAIAVARREVGAAEERRALGREPDVQRPSARPGERLHRAHVDGVDVGSLLAIDLDADVVTVEVAGDLLVLERLDLHHVTPVTGGVPDRHEERQAPAAGLGERLVAPGVPVDGIVGVLEEVRAGLEDEPVGVPRHVADAVTGARNVGRNGALSGRQRRAQPLGQLRRRWRRPGEPSDTAAGATVARPARLGRGGRVHPAGSRHHEQQHQQLPPDRELLHPRDATSRGADSGQTSDLVRCERACMRDLRPHAPDVGDRVCRRPAVDLLVLAVGATAGTGGN